MALNAIKLYCTQNKSTWNRCTCCCCGSLFGLVRSDARISKICLYHSSYLKKKIVCNVLVSPGITVCGFTSDGSNRRTCSCSLPIGLTSQKHWDQDGPGARCDWERNSETCPNFLWFGFTLNLTQADRTTSRSYTSCLTGGDIPQNGQRPTRKKKKIQFIDWPGPKTSPTPQVNNRTINSCSPVSEMAAAV